MSDEAENGAPEARSWRGPFSSFSTPRGQTVEHTPQPTHEARTTFWPRWAYHRTSMPISQYVEQLPHEMHWPPFVVMRKREKNRCWRPRTAAIGQPKRHHTRLPISG